MDERPAARVTWLAAALMLVLVFTAVVMRPRPHTSLAASEPVTLRIDPNTADAETLCLLPRIGPGIAQRIVDDRRANGAFASAQDMQRVPYVGEKTVDALRPWITVD